MSFSSETSFLYSLLSILKGVPLDFTFNYEKAKRLGLYEISHEEETEILLKELQNREEILKVIVKFLEELGSKWQEINDSSILLKVKIKQYKDKLSVHKQRQKDLCLQNQNLFLKLQEMSSILDEKERNYETLAETLTQTREQLQINEQTNKIHGILDTEKSIDEYLKNNIEKVKKDFPLYFCQCTGKFEKLKSSHQILVKKYQDLLEKQEFLETNSEKLSRTLTSVKLEHQILKNKSKTTPKKSLVILTAENFNKINFDIDGSDFNTKTNRSHSFFMNQKNQTEKKKKIKARKV